MHSVLQLLQLCIQAAQKRPGGNSRPQFIGPGSYCSGSAVQCLQHLRARMLPKWWTDRPNGRFCVGSTHTRTYTGNCRACTTDTEQQQQTHTPPTQSQILSGNSVPLLNTAPQHASAAARLHAPARMLLADAKERGTSNTMVPSACAGLLHAKHTYAS